MQCAVPECGQYQVHKAESGCQALDAVGVQVAVEGGHVHLEKVTVAVAGSGAVTCSGPTMALTKVTNERSMRGREQLMAWAREELLRARDTLGRGGQ